MSARKSLDTGCAITPTPRLPVFAAGQPAGNDLLDAGINANTILHVDTFNPPAGFTNPPSAAPDLGDQAA